MGLCGSSYKRACYTIVGSNNNTRRGQLSKRSQSHREGKGDAWGGGGDQRLCGKMWHRLKEGQRLGRGIRNEREAEKKPSSQKQLSMTVRGQTTGEEEDPNRHSHGA